MTLLPYVFRRLSSAAALALLLAASLTLSPSTYAAELEGTLVPLDSSIPAISSAPSTPSAQSTPPTPAAQSTPPTPVVVSADEASPPVSEPAPSAVILSNDEQSLRELEQRIESIFNKHSGNSNFELLQLVPIVAIIFSVGGPIFLIGFLIAKRYQNKQLRQQSLNNNIDKLLAAGRDIPVELLRGDEPQATVVAGNRDKGIRNICLGVGLLVFLTVLAGLDIGAIGFIWIALGVSQVLIWHLNQPKAMQPLELTGEKRAGQQD